MRALHAYLEVAFREPTRRCAAKSSMTTACCTPGPGRIRREAHCVHGASRRGAHRAGSESRWHAGPFSGEIRDGFVWDAVRGRQGQSHGDPRGRRVAGRGRIQPEAHHLSRFRHDEENGGERGAKAVAALFSQRAVHPSSCSMRLADRRRDHAGSRAARGADRDRREGFATLRVTASAPPGHSSMPVRAPHRVLASALVRIDQAPFRAAVGGVAAQTLTAIAPEMHGLNRVALSNLWLFEPLVRRQLMGTPSAMRCCGPRRPSP